MILQTLLRAVQAMIIGTMAGLMFLAATVLASLETVFRKKVRRKRRSTLWLSNWRIGASNLVQN